MEGNGTTRASAPTAAALLAVLLATLALALTACSSLSATTTPYVGAPHPPPTDPAHVEILRTQPTRQHDRLGEVVVTASTDPAPAVTEVEAKLRAEAAKLGADAAVVVVDRIQPVAVYVTGGYWYRSANTVTGRRLVAIAIKYR